MTMITDCDCKQEDNFDFQDLLRVARVFKEWQDYEEKFINDPSVSLADIDDRKRCALEALKEVEHLL